MTSVSELKSRTAHLPPADTDVNLPPAIRAAAMRANQLHEAAYKEPEEIKAEVKGDGKPANGDGKPVEQPAKQEEAPVAEETPPAEKTPASTPEDWEHKYNSLKGRYDRQDDTIRGLNARIDQLTSLIAAAPKTPQEQPPSEMKFGKLTDKDRDDFGEDFLDAAARAAEERFGPYLRSLEQQVRQLGGSVQNVAATTAQNAQQSMYGYLDEQMPDWRQINRDPKFLAWANLPDPLSGVIRVEMMRDAHQKADGARVLRFFRGFLNDEAASDPARRAEPETPSADKAKGKVPLSEFAAPGRAKAPAATDVPGEKETITHAQIAAFYLDVQKGKYRGNEAEKDRLEREIFKAQAENRVI